MSTRKEVSNTESTSARAIAREVARLLRSQSDDYMTKKQCAEYLKIGESTLDSYMSEGLPYFVVMHQGGKQSKLIRFRRSEVDRWMEGFRAANPGDVALQIEALFEADKVRNG